MAYDDKEIEVKIKLTESEFLMIKEKLAKIAQFQNKSDQMDKYFMPPNKNFLEPKYPFEWLSLRKRDEKVQLTYKHFYPENEKMKTYCDELETDIVNLEQFEKTLRALEFKELVTIKKERDVWIFEDFEIGLDSVKELGYFIEIEALKDFGGIEETRKKIFNFAILLGADIARIQRANYPFLLLEKKGIVKFAD